MAEALDLGRSDVGVSWLPFFHDMGLVGVLLSSLAARFSVHILRPSEFLFRPRRWLEVLSAARATITAGPNFGYELVTRRVRETTGLDLSSVRHALNGSEPVHRQTMSAFSLRFAEVGFRAEAFRPAYGLAENTLGVSFASAADPDLRWRERLLTSVGRPIRGVQVRVAGPTGEELPADVEGEIQVAGETVMSGYFAAPEATAEVFSSGWLRTGDLGIRSQGLLYVTGRLKELVIKAGQKFHPYDIERIVGDVLDVTPNGVAAFSRPSASLGTEELVVLAELRRQPVTDEHAILLQRIRGRLLEDLGVRLDRLALVSAGVLPRTTSGKLRRAECAERFGAAFVEEVIG
jgi:acyl-CoA synthetase (AMP-forming)/AMP-acid ligase II